MSWPTMKSSTVIAALLLTSFCWSSRAKIVQVEPGEEAILSCRIVSGKPEMFWGRLFNNGNYSCITNPTKNYSGIWNERFETSSNTSFVSLKIKHVKMDDSGFYFCFFNVFGSEVIDVVQLNVGDLKTTEDDNATPGPEVNSACERHLRIGAAMGGLCVLLLITIVGLALNIKKLLRAAQSQEHNGSLENQETDNLTYAALNFRSQARRTRALHDEPSIIYAATR